VAEHNPRNRLDFDVPKRGPLFQREIADLFLSETNIVDHLRREDADAFGNFISRQPE